jgi:hypothetical protein
MHLFILPDEILLEIISHIRFERAFGHAPSRNSTHEHGNQQCLNTLRSLCSTSKRLKSICEPILYSTLIVKPGRSSCRLAHYLLTVIARPVLQEYLKCVHYAALNIFPDDEKFEIEKFRPKDDWCTAEWSSFKWLPFRAHATRQATRIWSGSGQLRSMGWFSDLVVAPEQPLLALVLGLTYNTLEDVTVTSLDRDGSCLDAVLSLHDSAPVAGRGYELRFPRLQRLDLVIVCDNRDATYFSYCPLRLPSLVFLQLRGPAHVWHESNGSSIRVTTLNLLQRKYGLSLGTLQDFCSIEVLFLQWVCFDIPGPMDFGPMHEALSTQKDSLQSLTLVVNSYGMYTEIDPFRPFRHLGSFRAFASLRVLRIPAFFLLGAPDGTMYLLDPEFGYWGTEKAISVRISELLPPSLEHFEIINDLGLRDDALELKELADDCYSLPLLKAVHLARCPGTFDNLAARFAVHGVSFTTHWDRDSSASDPFFHFY